MLLISQHLGSPGSRYLCGDSPVTKDKTVSIGLTKLTLPGSRIDQEIEGYFA